MALFRSLRQNHAWDQDKQGQYTCIAAQLRLSWELVPAQCWGWAIGNWSVSGWAEDLLFSNRQVLLDAYTTLKNLAVVM